MRRTVAVLGSLTACAIIALVSLPGDRQPDGDVVLPTPASEERQEAKPLLVPDQAKTRTAVKVQKKNVQPLAVLSESRADRSLVELDARHTTAAPVPHHPAPTFEDRERYPDAAQSSIKLASDEPVSTFSIDVDTAAYANVRRFLEDGQRPPVDAVRVEELINYFDYDYASPDVVDHPFAADIVLFTSPWDPGSQLLRIGIKGYEIERTERPRANLVFLVDTSGSMDRPDKLPLLQRSLRLLVDQMRDDDRIAIVTYAGSAGVVLEPTEAVERAKINRAIEGFHAGGGTAGAAGIRQAYRLAEAGFDEAAVNRVILATDGDFNVGISDPERLEEFIAGKRKSGVYLSILGFGRGNLNDLLMQKLAQSGNGNASYIDGLMEARKVLVDEMGSTLFPIADDVKIQVEFNPKRVAEYRLIGYETRMIRREDFNNDKIDAGEIGSGHRVTALYEVTAPGSPSRLIDDLRYGVEPASLDQSSGEADEIAWLRLRYKRPGEDQSQLIERPIRADMATEFEGASSDARFASAVAAFGEILRQSPHMGTYGLDAVLDIARTARGEDPFGYRSEFLRLIQLAKSAEALHVGDG